MNRVLLVAYSILFGSIALAQTNTLSPYSIYGLGDSPYAGLTAQAGVSHTNIAMLNVQNINVSNPANLAYITRPTFNFDFRSELLALSTSGTTQGNNLFSIENFSFAFPLINDLRRKRRAAISFGLKPYSRMGYDVVSYDQVPDFGLVEYRFLGEGGLNSAFFGGAFDVYADSGRVNTLTIGAIGSYVFGSLYRNRITMVDSTTFLNGSNLFREEQNEISSFDARIGLLYARKVKWNSGTEKEASGSVSVGGFFQPQVSLSTSTNTIAYTFFNTFTAPSLIDTIAYRTSSAPTIAPASFGLGLGMTYDGRFTLGLDLSSTQWSVLEIDGVNSGLNDEYRASAGLEYVPDPTSYKQLRKIIRYRAGLSLERTRLNVDGIQPNRLGISAGLGIPVIASRSTSMLNLGIEYARRGANALPVVEHYFNVHIGMTLTPSQFDRWFAKRKYD
jgi:hypothetical protein